MSVQHKIDEFPSHIRRTDVYVRVADYQSDPDRNCTAKTTQRRPHPLIETKQKKTTLMPAIPQKLEGMRMLPPPSVTYTVAPSQVDFGHHQGHAPLANLQQSDLPRLPQTGESEADLLRRFWASAWNQAAAECE